MIIENLLKSIKLSDGTIIEIPERLSKLKNDVGYITASRLKTLNGTSLIGSGSIKVVVPSDLDKFAKKEDLERVESILSVISPSSNKIPERLSELKNDMGYITASRFKTLNGISIIGRGDIKIATLEDLEKFIKKEDYNKLLMSLNNAEEERSSIFLESQEKREEEFVKSENLRDLKIQELETKINTLNNTTLEKLFSWQTTFERNEEERQERFDAVLGANLTTVEELKTKSDLHDSYLTWNEQTN